MDMSDNELYLLSKRILHMMAYGNPSERDSHIEVRKRLIDTLLNTQTREEDDKFIRDLIRKTHKPVQELARAAAEDLFKLTKHIKAYVKELETAEYSSEDQAFIDRVLDEAKRYSREVNGNDLFVQ